MRGGFNRLFTLIFDDCLKTLNTCFTRRYGAAEKNTGLNEC